MNRSFSKIRHIQEANLKLEKRMLNESSEMDESLWGDIFGKPKVSDAAKTHLKGKGFSHTGKNNPTSLTSDEEPDYIIFNGDKYYQDQIEYADYHDLGELPRVENGKLIIANPAWNL